MFTQKVKLKKTTKITEQTKRRRGLQATEINVNDLDQLVMCFPKTRRSGSQSGGLAAVARGRERSPGACGRGGHSGAAARSSSAAAAGARGPAAPGGPSRVTPGHGAAGVKCASSFAAGVIHRAPSQVLRQQNAPAAGTQITMRLHMGA